MFKAIAVAVVLVLSFNIVYGAVSTAKHLKEVMDQRHSLIQSVVSK